MNLDSAIFKHSLAVGISLFAIMASTIVSGNALLSVIMLVVMINIAASVRGIYVLAVQKGKESK